MNEVTLNDSTVEGDLVSGDKYQYEAPLSPLEKALKAVKAAAADNEEIQGFIEELSEYMEHRGGRKVIGLEAKLIAGNREDILSEATYLKNKFERRLTKQQLSYVEQQIYCHVLANIISVFNMKILPLIKQGASPVEVDSSVYDYVVAPVYSAIVQHDIGITVEHVRGMLYFLTGKCHLVWSAEC
ncbi:MAG: ABC-three component system protein [Candidatus Thiodiazotropha taylori]